jgi:hypothetical protein
MQWRSSALAWLHWHSFSSFVVAVFVAADSLSPADINHRYALRDVVDRHLFPSDHFLLETAPPRVRMTVER